jgi:hypothetical protein
MPGADGHACTNVGSRVRPAVPVIMLLDHTRPKCNRRVHGNCQAANPMV